MLVFVWDCFLCSNELIVLRNFPFDFFSEKVRYASTLKMPVGTQKTFLWNVFFEHKDTFAQKYFPEKNIANSSEILIHASCFTISLHYSFSDMFINICRIMFCKREITNNFDMKAFDMIYWAIKKDIVKLS